jgi:hypothetical protein
LSDFKIRRLLRIKNFQPPQRPSLSFDTPCDVTNRREHSNDRNLKLVPFALHEVDDEQVSLILCFIAINLNVQYMYIQKPDDPAFEWSTLGHFLSPAFGLLA